jgi:hypothetical protein
MRNKLSWLGTLALGLVWLFLAWPLLAGTGEGIYFGLSVWPPNPFSVAFMIVGLAFLLFFIGLGAFLARPYLRR